MNSKLKDNYPTEEGLNDLKILLNDINSITQKTFKRKEIIEEIKANWWCPAYIRQTTNRLYLSTCGWSGNEDTIGVILDTMFSHFYWISSTRGGHYVFELPEEEV